ncbi:response regulator [Desulfobacterales bacterium HSG17]|nr:response regulator [Desulfobacterales bacterium HSG17]
MKNAHILLVDDDEIILQSISLDLESRGFKVTALSSGIAALELLSKQTFDLVISDLVMDSIDGIQILKAAKSHWPDIGVLILTGYGDLNSAIKAVRFRADDYLLKPCDPDELEFRIARCLEHADLKKRVRMYEDIVPICCMCKKIRDDKDAPGKGDWMSVENYLWQNKGISPTSTYCPECLVVVEKDMESRGVS